MPGYSTGKPHVLRSRGGCGEERDVGLGIVQQSGTWILIEGDDIMTPQVVERHEAWLQTQQLTGQSTLAYQDRDFLPGPKAVDGRAEVESRKNIFKATLSEVAASIPTGSMNGNDEPPLCLCGRPGRMATMQNGHAKGRQYWKCSTRQCRFFEFADESSTLAALELSWVSLGPPEWRVVGDEGFRPEHLRQGGVGDCWFMSALAVVAERHDLVSKLLPNLNEGLVSGCHEIRLFIDGRWTGALLDSFFPKAAPNKQRRQDETGLAFGRASERQLWVPLLEKAYARAHGAYKSISGGQVSEAMLDLTGCPTETVSFRTPGFDKDLFWATLLSFVQAQFPIGCGTNAETVEELGLVGQHAYSVLDAGERCANWMDPQAAPERMVKVRNPWGEWTRREYDEILQSLGAAVTSDGAFWMRYNDFIRGFANIEVCKARPGWHARSFEVGFQPGLGTGMRRVLHLHVSERTECYIMAIQPTERGAQLKRARGYHLNDVSYALLSTDNGSLHCMTFGGAKRDVMGDSCFLEPGREYTIVPFSFKARAGGCVVRIYSSEPVRAQLKDSSRDYAAHLWAGLHCFAMSTINISECRLQRMLHRIVSNKSGKHLGRLVLLEAEALAVGIVINESSEPMQIDLLLEASQMVARTPHGLSEGSPRLSSSPKPQKNNKKRSGKGEQAEDWHEFAFQAVIPRSCQQLVFAMIPCTRMHGDYDLSLIAISAQEASSNHQATCSPEDPFSPIAAALPALSALPSSEDVGFHAVDGDDDAELRAAISASLDEQGLHPEAKTHDDSENGLVDGDDDAELLAAISASLDEQGLHPEAKTHDDSGNSLDDHTVSIDVMDNYVDDVFDVQADAELLLALAMSLDENQRVHMEKPPQETEGRIISSSMENQNESHPITSSDSAAHTKRRWNRHRAQPEHPS
jgi:hypothetical protein